MQVKQNKEFIHHFPWVFSHLQESSAPSHLSITWEDKHHHSKHPPASFFFPQLYMLNMMSYGLEYPLGQLGSAVPAVSPPNSLCPPSLLTGGVGEEAEKPLALCEHCSEIAKTSLCYQHCFQHRSKT